jgi:hypothetical protein
MRHDFDHTLRKIALRAQKPWRSQNNTRPETKTRHGATFQHECHEALLRLGDRLRPLSQHPSPDADTLQGAAWALTTPDLAAEKRIAEEIQRHAWQEVPFIPLGLVLPPQAYRRSIRDVVKGGPALFWGVKRA